MIHIVERLFWKEPQGAGNFMKSVLMALSMEIEIMEENRLLTEETLVITTEEIQLSKTTTATY